MPFNLSATQCRDNLGGYGVRVPTTLLDLGVDGMRLRVEVSVQATLAPGEPWFDTDLVAQATPYAGSLRTTFTLSDLHAWRERLAALDDGLGKAVLGGDRAAELVIKAKRQQGGEPGRRALSLSLTPSGDDPHPKLTWLLFDVAPTWATDAIAAIDAL
jgi:hypothetical protein